MLIDKKLHSITEQIPSSQTEHKKEIVHKINSVEAIPFPLNIPKLFSNTEMDPEAILKDLDCNRIENILDMR